MTDTSQPGFQRVLVRYEEDEGVWRIYWTETMELADERDFATIEEAGRVVQAMTAPSFPPKLGLIKPTE